MDAVLYLSLLLGGGVKKNKTTTKIKQTIKKTTKTPKAIHKYQKQKKKHKKETHSIFPNDFSHVVYLFPYQNFLGKIHLRY